MLRAKAPTSMRIPPVLTSVPAVLFAACAALALVLVLRNGDGSAVHRAQGPGGKGAITAPKDRSVVPCSAAAADWVGALVDPSRVKAVPGQIEKYSTLRLHPERWKDLPRFDRVDAENVLAYSPDLVLVSPVTHAATVTRMREVGLKVLVVREPTTWPELLETGRLLAEATGTEKRWAEFRSELEARREALQNAAPEPALRLLAYGNFGADSYTCGSGSTIDLALGLSGHRNHAGDLGLQGSATIAAEALLASPFDAFVVSGSEGNSQSAAALRGNPLLQDLAPVTEHRMIYIEDALYSSGSFTILDAAEQIAAQAVGLREAQGDPAGSR